VIEQAAPRLSEWESFYVIVGSSAAALTGLMFVVIALRTELRADTAGAERAFATPNVGHFCAVLLVAAVVSTPGHTFGSLAACVAATGVAGLALSAWVIVQARRQHGYAMVASDWLWHVALPIVAYAVIGIAGIAVLLRAAGGLHLVAAAALLLLFIGIHNAWDSAVYIATQRTPGER
jgi:ABC-type dipeptide/oligopeptide/nickel transport system permease component